MQSTQPTPRIHASNCRCRRCRPVGPNLHRSHPATLRIAAIIAALALLIALRTCLSI